MYNREEPILKTAMRGHYKERFFFFGTSSSDVGSSTSNSEPETSLREFLGSSARIAGSPEGSHFEAQQPHEVIFLFQHAHHN